ncbi:MAG: AI-2E family transporter [Candidatus Pacearchaeota archaeon]
MGESEDFKKIIYTGIIVGLFVLAYLLLKPLILVIAFALILAFVFQPVYNKLSRLIRSKNVSALIICIIFAALIIIPVWLLSPMLVDQSFEIYQKAQGTDFSEPIKALFPDRPASNNLAEEMGSSIHDFVTNITNSAMNIFSNMITGFPTLVLKTLVLFFTFFVALKEQNSISEYIRSVLPFNENIKKKLFRASKGVTSSVIFGQVILGIIEGLLIGVGLFIFNVDNALLLTIVAALAGIFPIIGTAVIWIPTTILLFVSGSYLPALGILGFGILSAVIDGVVKPIFISRKVSMHSALVLLGMVGGLLLFGIIGAILGPLILAYLFIILEIYRDRNKKKERDAPHAVEKRETK